MPTAEQANAENAAYRGVAPQTPGVATTYAPGTGGTIEEAMVITSGPYVGYTISDLVGWVHPSTINEIRNSGQISMKYGSQFSPSGYVPTGGDKTSAQAQSENAAYQQAQIVGSPQWYQQQVYGREVSAKSNVIGSQNQPAVGSLSEASGMVWTGTGWANPSNYSPTYTAQRGASQIASEIAAGGGIVNPYLASKAYSEGYSGNMLLPVTSQGALDLGRSTVPTRDLSSQMLTPSEISKAEGKTVTLYTPYGEYAQTEVAKAKLLVGKDTGELGAYQKPYGRSTYNLASGGGRNALQSGMFTVNAPETPFVAKQEETGTFNLPSGEGLSRLGAEAYGGFVLPLDNRTLGKAELSTYENPLNLANYVNPQGPNLSKTEAPGAKIPWSISKEAPAIQYMNEKGAVPGSETAFAKIVPLAPVTVAATEIPVVKTEAPQLPTPFVSTAGTTQKASEEWYKGIPLVGGFVPEGVFKKTSEITEPVYGAGVRAISPIETTRVGTPFEVSRSELESKQAGTEYSRTFVTPEGKKTPTYTEAVGLPTVTTNPLTGEKTTTQPYETYNIGKVTVTPVSTTIGPSQLGQKYEDIKLSVQSYLPESAKMESLIKSSQLSSPLAGPTIFAGYGAEKISELIGGKGSEYSKQVKSQSQLAYELAPGSLSGQYTQFREEPFMTVGSYALMGVPIGAATRGIAEVYPSLRAAAGTGRVGAALDVGSKYIGPALTGIYSADIAYRSTEGGTKFEGSLSRAKALTIQEAVPMGAGFGAGYNIPESVSGAYRTVSRVPEYASQRFFEFKQSGMGIERMPEATAPRQYLDNELASFSYTGVERPEPIKPQAVEPIQNAYKSPTGIQNFQMPHDDYITAGKMWHSQEFSDINAALKSDIPQVESDYYKKARFIIDTIESHGSIIDEPTIYRGIRPGSTSATKLSSLKEGDIYDFRGIQSFTTDLSVAKKYSNKMEGDAAFRSDLRGGGYILEYSPKSTIRGIYYSDVYGGIGSHKIPGYADPLGVSEITIAPRQYKISEIRGNSIRITDIDVPREHMAIVGKESSPVEYIKTRYPEQKEIWTDYLTQTQLIKPMEAPTIETVRGVYKPTLEEAKFLIESKYPNSKVSDYLTGRTTPKFEKIESTGGEQRYRVLEGTIGAPEGTILTTGEGRGVKFGSLYYESVVRPASVGKYERTYGKPLEQTEIYKTATPKEQRLMREEERAVITEAQRLYRPKYGGAGGLGGGGGGRRTGSDRGFSVSSGIGGGSGQQLVSMPTISQSSGAMWPGSQRQKLLSLLAEEEAYLTSPESIRQSAQATEQLRATAMSTVIEPRSISEQGVSPYPTTMSETEKSVALAQSQRLGSLQKIASESKSISEQMRISELSKTEELKPTQTITPKMSIDVMQRTSPIQENARTSITSLDQRTTLIQTPVVTPTVITEPAKVKVPKLVPDLVTPIIPTLPSLSGSVAQPWGFRRTRRFTETLPIGTGVGWISIVPQQARRARVPPKPPKPLPTSTVAPLKMPAMRVKTPTPIKKGKRRKMFGF